MTVRDSANVIICKAISTSTFLDGLRHTALIAYDSTAGTLSFIVDGVEERDIGHPDETAPTTGTLDTGTSKLNVGASSVPSNHFDGEIGFCGLADAYLTNHEDFMSEATPKALDESGWTEFGSQPLFWNEDGEMDVNQGTGGNMTENGTITGPA